MTKYAVIMFLLVVQTVVGLFGGYAGYEVAGVPVVGDISEEAPGIFGIIEWVWDSLTFMFYMLTFQVDNMPVFISAIFVIMLLMSIYLVISLIRGVS